MALVHKYSLLDGSPYRFPSRRLPPASTPEPVATTKAVHPSRPTSQHPAPVSVYPSSPLSPLAHPFKPAGHSKEERWSDGSPASEGSVSLLRRASYRDVLLAPPVLAAAAESLESFALLVDRPPVKRQPRLPRPPRQLRSVIMGNIRSEVRHGRLAGRGPDADGFQLVLQR